MKFTKTKEHGAENIYAKRKDTMIKKYTVTNKLTTKEIIQIPVQSPSISVLHAEYKQSFKLCPSYVFHLFYL
jgi:hypothetical protein